MEQGKWWHRALIIALSLGIAGLFSAFLSSDFSSIDIFAPIEKKVDFKVSDIYNMIEEERQGRERSNEVVVIGVDEYDREGVVEIIHTLTEYGAKAIGLDIYFSIPKANDSALIETIRTTENMVCITKVVREEDGYYRMEDQSFFDPYMTPPHKGYANLDIDHSWNVVRTFIPQVRTREGKQIPGMALALAQIADPARAEEAIRRGNTEEIIDFTHQEIEIIPAHRLQNTDMAERIQGKVVLIGLIHDNKDIYLTPLHAPVAGVIIHAYATQTILNGNYIRTRAVWHNWLVAAILCLILLCLLLLANEYEPMKYSLNLAVRILMFVTMFALVYIGCIIFAKHHLYVDYSPAIMMLAFGTLAFDIVYAGFGVCKQIYKKKQSKIHKP